MHELLQAERDELESILEELHEGAAAARDAARADVALPGDEVMAKIQRYETMIERELYQAITQLERLQRRRLGEASIPPVSVNVTHGN